jgi:ankyrin repeat protein
LPLIQKEIETETQYKQGIERLIESIVDCNVYKVKFHLENGANANTKYNNWSLLHYACSMIDQVYSGTDQHLELIRILLEHGAEINSQDEDRWTPLHLACQLGVVRVIS